MKIAEKFLQGHKRIEKIIWNCYDWNAIQDFRL